MKCPSCGLENPPSSKTCDCGYALAGGESIVRVTPIATPAAGAVRLVWLLPLLGTVAAGLQMYLGWDSAKSAPQQAALAGFALAWAVIPCCFARAVMGLAGKT